MTPLSLLPVLSVFDLEPKKSRLVPTLSARTAEGFHNKILKNLRGSEYNFEKNDYSVSRKKLADGAKIIAQKRQKFMIQRYRDRVEDPKYSVMMCTDYSSAKIKHKPSIGVITSRTLSDHFDLDIDLLALTDIEDVESKNNSFTYQYVHQLLPPGLKTDVENDITVEITVVTDNDATMNAAFDGRNHTSTEIYKIIRSGCHSHYINKSSENTAKTCLFFKVIKKINKHYLLSGQPTIRGELRIFGKAWIRRVKGTRQWRIEFMLVAVFLANYEILIIDEKLKKYLDKKKVRSTEF